TPIRLNTARITRPTISATPRSPAGLVHLFFSVMTMGPPVVDVIELVSGRATPRWPHTPGAAGYRLPASKPAGSGRGRCRGTAAPAPAGARPADRPPHP